MFLKENAARNTKIKSHVVQALFFITNVFREVSIISLKMEGNQVSMNGQYDLGVV